MTLPLTEEDLRQLLRDPECPSGLAEYIRRALGLTQKKTAIIPSSEGLHAVEVEQDAVH